MDNLLGQISSKLAPKTTLHVVTDLKQTPASFSIPSARSRSSPSPKQELPARDEEEQLEVTSREDSESYAKRTITEIETCLGFTFHGAGGAEEEPAEAISNNELETLNTQVEAALQSGLNFKDRFTTGSRKRLLVVPAEPEEPAQESASPPENEDHVQEQAAQQHYAQQEHQQQSNDQQDQTQQQAGKAGKQGPSALGLQLAVGSHMETGEWKSNGLWVKKEKQEQAVPSNLQVIPAEDLVKVRELGRGCFGSVWLTKWRGVEVALKEVLNPSATDTAAVDVFNEAEKLASLQHPCVMAFYGVVNSPGNCATIAEYICHGSLRSGLAKIKRKGINDKRLRAYIALQAAYGMEYLHLHFMVHFDLKCDNLLCDLRDLNKPVVKIGDLGLSKTKKGSFISGNMRGTLPWMAPELFPSVPGAVSGMNRKEAEDRVTEKVDVFSFGIVLWEIWTLGEQPYPNLSLQEIFAGVMTGTLRPAIPPGCDQDWVQLMQDCWHAVPRMRPSFTDIISRLEAMLQRWSQQQPGVSSGSPPTAARAAAPGLQGPAGAFEPRPGVQPAARGLAVGVPRGAA